MVSLVELYEVPIKNLILLVGPPGSGKSTFCQQTVLRNIEVRPVIYVTTESAPLKVIDSLREKGLGEALPPALGFVDAFHETVGLSTADRPDTVKASSEDLTSLGIAISKMQERMGENSLLVFDSLTSPYLFNGSEILRFMRTSLVRFAAEGNAVIAGIDEGCGKPEDLVAMMSLADGLIKIELEDHKKFLDVIKHPKVISTRIEVPTEPQNVGLETRIFDWDALKGYRQSFDRADDKWIRKETGDFVNLFWPNLAHWSGMLWDPKGFAAMTHEVNKDDGISLFKTTKEDKSALNVFPWSMRLFLRFLSPKNLSKPKDMRKFFRMGEINWKMERSGIAEYLEDSSRNDEHYFRVYESADCCLFKDIGTTIASYLPPFTAGACQGLEYSKGLERDWNAIETKCIGLGDPYCEVKVVPGELDDLKDSLVKDAVVLERIRERLIDRLMGFMIDGKPLVERPRLGSDVSLHPVWHAMGGEGIPAMGIVWSERYRMALRMGGVKSGRDVGQRLLEAGIGKKEAVKHILDFLTYCKVGKVTIDETIKIQENCESLWSKLYEEPLYKWKEPLCFFTTGFLNGVFSAVKNQHVKETKCLGLGDPYCEWEFR
jgi:predicted hydrocarbon binding protein/KaiC/GvpD/RAD55 family RecA-like ATPase